LLWIESVDLLRGGGTWLPFECVHIDCARPAHPGAGAFSCSSNGLASGNNIWEASIHAITEVIEREGLHQFDALTADAQDVRKIRLESIDDSGARSVLDLYERAEMDVAVWETTEHTGIPAFKCGIMARTGAKHERPGTFYGSGCHPSRDVAVCRALTEAAQSRLTLISGARDDMPRSLFETEANPERMAADRALFARGSAGRSFADSPSFDTDDLEHDMRWLLSRLEAAGYGSALLVDLTLPAFGVPVVRVVIPGVRGVAGLAPAGARDAQ
jgi:ribosomal protein S12 methylthiotransferase accessory factor